MKTILIILAFLVGYGEFLFVKLLVESNKTSFEIKNGKVYYCTPANGVPSRNWNEIPEANAASFKKLAFPFGKDDQHVFYYADIIIGADVESFELFGSNKNYSKDKHHIYYTTSPISDHPATFKLVTPGLAKDHKRVYRFGHPVEGADPETFEEIQLWYYKDKNHVYRDVKWGMEGVKILAGANPDHFVINSKNPKEANDGKTFYYEGDIIRKPGVKSMKY